MCRMYDKRNRSFFTSFYHSKGYHDNKTIPLRVIINVALKSYSLTRRLTVKIYYASVSFERSKQSKKEERRKPLVTMLSTYLQNARKFAFIRILCRIRVNNWRTERNETRLEEWPAPVDRCYLNGELGINWEGITLAQYFLGRSSMQPHIRFSLPLPTFIYKRSSILSNFESRNCSFFFLFYILSDSLIVENYFMNVKYGLNTLFYVLAYGQICRSILWMWDTDWKN